MRPLSLKCFRIKGFFFNFLEYVCVCMYVCVYFFFIFLFFYFFGLFGAAPLAHGGSQARGPIRAESASLHHSHSNAGSKPHLRPAPQLMAVPDPLPTEQGQRSNPRPHGCPSDLRTTEPRRELPCALSN